MDSFGEQLVKKQTTTADWIKRICLVLGGLAFAILCMTLSFMTGFMILTVIAVAALFGLVWLLSGMGCEYEYIVTNEDLDIDKITGKRKRKRLITMKLNTAEEFGAYDGSQGNDVQATVIATDGTGVNAHYLITMHKTHGRTMLIFSPDSRTCELIMNSLPYKVKAAAKPNGNYRTAASADNTESENQ